tara:strand:+ start:2402 stop:2809 length:408 start_codon:yes stop_codon:yes gene_type:complete
LKESLLWRYINLIQKTEPTWHLVRIESSTINGIPDVNGIIDGKEFWVELKANDAKNAGLSKFQINFHLKRIKLGGRCFILNASPSKRCLELLVVREPGIPIPVSRFPFHKKHIRDLLLLAADPAGAAELDPSATS